MLTKSLSNKSLNSLIIEKEEFSTSKGTERKESTDIVLERGLENDIHHTRNVTDNRAFRKSESKQQREVNIDTGKETDGDKTLLTYADRVEEPTEQVVDLSLIYSDLLAGENSLLKWIHLLQIYALTQRIYQTTLVVLKEKKTSFFSVRRIRRYFPS